MGVKLFPDVINWMAIDKIVYPMNDPEDVCMQLRWKVNFTVRSF